MRIGTAASDTGIVIADKAYDAQARAMGPLQRASKAVFIPSTRLRKVQRSYDTHLYRACHLIKHSLVRLKRYRAIAIRYDRIAHDFLGAIHLAAAVVWLN